MAGGDAGPSADLAERLTGWARRSAAAHPVLARRLRQAYRWWYWTAIPVVALALVFIPDARRSVGVYLGIFFVMWELAVLGRSRSLSFPAIMRLTSLGALVAMPIAIAEVVIGDAAGWSALSVQASVYVAGPVEETLKLLPLVLFALVAPNRLRRFGAVDFLLAGAAGGAGFQLVEDTTRRVTAGGAGAFLRNLFGYDTAYSWHSWLRGWSDNGGFISSGTRPTALSSGR